MSGIRRLIKTDLLTGALLLLMLGPWSVFASTSGNLKGLLLNEAGEPVSNVLISLLDKASSASLPTLTLSDELGQVALRDLSPGMYQVLVKSARYRSPVGRVVEILPNRTILITLILQEVFSLDEGGAENLGLKALLRTSDEKRLIFRNNPVINGGIPDFETSEPLFDDAVFQVYTNGGFGGDYFVFPGDSWGGTTSNFAVVDSIGGNKEYVFAGQLNSGEDSIWRLKNIINYRLSDSNSLKLFFGYGRMSFEQPSLSLLANPGHLRDDVAYTSAVGTSKLLNVGVENTLNFGPAVTLTWGLEVDEFRSEQREVFASPSAELKFRPLERTDVQLSMTSKRPSIGNTLTLPNGQHVSLASPLLIARIGDTLTHGLQRHYRGSVTHWVDDDTQVEVALFENRRIGLGLPIVAVFEVVANPEMIQMEGRQSSTQGYSLSVKRSFRHNLKAEVSYVRAKGPGLEDGLISAGGISNRAFGQLIGKQLFHVFSAQVEAYLPKSRTHVTALVKLVPKDDPLVTLDPYRDMYETGNEGVNLFIRQIVPLPEDLLSFFGLEFLAPESVEALLDIRNLLNDDIGTLQTAMGNASLIQSPRSVRGGISFRF